MIEGGASDIIPVGRVFHFVLLDLYRFYLDGFDGRFFGVACFDGLGVAHRTAEEVAFAVTADVF